MEEGMSEGMEKWKKGREREEGKERGGDIIDCGGKGREKKERKEKEKREDKEDGKRIDKLLENTKGEGINRIENRRLDR